MDFDMDFILLIISICVLVACLLILAAIRKTNDIVSKNASQKDNSALEMQKMQSELKDAIASKMTETMQNINNSNIAQAQQNRNQMTELNKITNDLTVKSIDASGKQIYAMLKTSEASEKELLEGQGKLINSSLSALTKTTETRLDLLTKTIDEKFEKQRTENSAQIDKIRETVNEKLDKTLNEQFEKSFKGVINQMTQLQTTMGELKGISTQVGSLEKTLNGVKTRGIMGEVQLKAIISDVLAPDQYDIEVPTIPGSNDHVEIAIKLPTRESDGYIYLPVDSKCHLDRYEELVNAYDSCDKTLIEKAKKSFADSIKNDAKTISEKYVLVPHTTPYAILFVPFEGMYSEIVGLNILGELNKQHITIAGPYTMMAILSTVTNYFQALAIEKKSNEIEKVLGAVKMEFTKYDDYLSQVRKSFEAASKKLDTLQATRTKSVLRALKNVTTLDAGTNASQVLGANNYDADSTDSEDSEDALTEVANEDTDNE